jgi:hypothetical protein
MRNVLIAVKALWQTVSTGSTVWALCSSEPFFQAIRRWHMSNAMFGIIGSVAMLLWLLFAELHHRHAQTGSKTNRKNTKIPVTSNGFNLVIIVVALVTIIVSFFAPKIWYIYMPNGIHPRSLSLSPDGQRVIFVGVDDHNHTQLFQSHWNKWLRSYSGPVPISDTAPSSQKSNNPDYCTPLGNPLRPDQKELATWDPSMNEVEKDIAVLPSGIDYSIKASDPATWPMYYKWIRSRGNIALFDYLCQNQIRTASPRCYIPAELIRSQAQPSATDPDYIHAIEHWGITFYARHPLTNVWLTPDQSDPYLSNP